MNNLKLKNLDSFYYELKRNEKVCFIIMKSITDFFLGCDGWMDGAHSVSNLRNE